MNSSTFEKMLTALGPIGLTFVLVVAVGYMIRLLPFVSNKYIPLFAPLIGSLAMWLIAPKDFVDPKWRYPEAVLIIYGFIVGCAAWMAHLLIIQRIEDWLRTKVPAVDKFLTSTEDKPKTAVIETSTVTDSSTGSKVETTKYTGDKLIGIGVLHKSCLQPIFNQQDATDIARMRR